MDNYIDINRDSWNSRLETHLQSDFYDMPQFMKGASSLNDIELNMLGDIKGKKILHLQCHFGQDTISLSRMGAEVTGVDLSNEAIDKAQSLAKELGTTAKFICSNVYDLERHLYEQFDIVFTSYGTISWLPELDKWGAIIYRYLKPGGQFVFAEFHPIVWMYDNDFHEIKYYYNNVEPIAEEEKGTYADKSANIKQAYICWNHGIGEVINSLIKNGLTINELKEYDYAPYPFVNDTIKISSKKYQIKKLGDKVPLVYSVIATKQ